MAAHDEKIDQLRQLVEKSSDLADPFRYFMDHFGDRQEFISSSTPTKNATLVKILKEAVLHYFKKNLNTKECLVLEYKLYTNLLHGTCMDSGYLIVFFFFIDLNVGMAALVKMAKPDMTHFCRFRATVLQGKHVNFHPGTTVLQ